MNGEAIRVPIKFVAIIGCLELISRVRALAAYTQEVTLRPSFNSAVDRAIMVKCAKEISPSISELFVSPLERVGFSGARLFRCHTNGGRVFVVKIDKLAAIRDEAAAIVDIRPYLHVDILGDPPITHRGYGALIHPFAGAGNLRQTLQVKELGDAIYSGDGAKDKKVLTAVKATYALVEGCELAEPEPFTFLGEYADYVRGHASQRVLESFLAPRSHEANLRFIGTQLRNPALFIKDERFATSVTGMKGPIHGDLHPKNVMIGPNETPHLIDYAWAQPSAHRTKDHVLMECSVRFMVFPGYTNLDEQLRVDRELLSLRGPARIAELTRKSVLRREYQLMAKIVQVIRSSATKFLYDKSDVGFCEYLAAQYLVLYGLLAYPDYQTPVSVRALGMIAKELDRAWHPA